MLPAKSSYRYLLSQNLWNGAEQSESFSEIDEQSLQFVLMYYVGTTNFQNW